MTLAVPIVVTVALSYKLLRVREASVKLAVGEDLNCPVRPEGVLQFITPMRLAIALGILVATATSFAVYVRNLGDPNAFMQNYDNAWHLSRIHLFAETQNYSTLAGGFYPSAWHGIAAMVEAALGCSTAMAEHAANLAFIVSVFPVGSTILLSTLFPERPRVVCLGGMLCLSFAFFPWRIMLFGPLYPNLADFTMMPVVAALFINMCRKGIPSFERKRYAILFVVGGIALALAQPNVIFSTGAFLIPYCIWRFRELVFDMLEGRKHRVLYSILAAAALTLAFVLVWVALTQMPFMRGVVYYPREAPLEFGKAVRWALGFSFVIKRQQYLIAIVVAIGALMLFIRSGRRWVPCSYALLLTLFVACISIDGPLQNILAGFWYCDYYRLAATVCEFAVPLLSVGMDAIVGAVLWIVRHICVGIRARECAPAIGCGAAALTVALIMAINYIPFSFIEQYYRCYGFDAVSFEMRDMYQNEGNITLGEEEIAFIEEVKDIVPDGAEVYNIPFDGSAFAFSACDLNVAYKAFGMDMDTRSSAARLNLNAVATNQEVQRAVEEENIQYVLLLDQGAEENGFSDGGSISTLGYLPEEWLGITRLSDSTPGFECLLSRGDMRLYRVVSS